MNTFKTIIAPIVIAIGFIVSGASALVYQVSWQRILALQSGVGIYSVAMIVGAFMAGLGIGSYLGGLTSRGMSPRQALHTFALIEIGIGGFALASSWLFYDLLYTQYGWLFANPWRAGLIQFLSLLIPTTLMGMSLPFLAQGVARHVSSAARTLGFYYGLNAIGAALGAFITTWFLIRFFGISGAISLGAAGNLCVGAAIFVLARFLPVNVNSLEPDKSSSASTTTPSVDTNLPFTGWVALYSVSGFCALSLEIIWFRVLDVAVKSTAFTFGTVLSIFLLGLGVGSAIGGVWAQRLRHPLRAFLICQCLLLILSGLSLGLLSVIPIDTTYFSGFVDYWSQYTEFPLGRSDDTSWIYKLYVALPLALYGLPTLLMGLSFGILQRAVQNDSSTAGFKVGALQGANIFGNVLGSLLTGLVLLSWIGTTGSVRILLLIGVGFALVGVWKFSQNGPRGIFPTLIVMLIGVWALLPENESFWRQLHGNKDATTLIGEDATGVSAISPEIDSPGIFRVSVNGKGHSHIPFGGVHTVLGAVPAAIHPSPTRVAIIGLGSGDTAWAAGFRSATKQVDVFELVAPELNLLKRLIDREGAETFPKLNGLLNDKRYSIRPTDGRAAIALGDQSYDIIEADALRPTSAYSGNLYSVEFFRMCSEHLAPGGMVAFWAPTARIKSSILEVFEHVLEIPTVNVIVASLEPITLVPAEWQKRLNTAEEFNYLGFELATLVTNEIAYAQVAVFEPESTTQTNHDLFPRDEFSTPIGY